MASLSVSLSGSNINWTISGLESPFNTTYYRYVGIALEPAQGTPYEPEGVLDTVSAPTSGSSRSVSGSFSKNMLGYGGLWTLYAYALPAQDPNYWPAGSDTIELAYEEYVVFWEDDGDIAWTIYTGYKWNRSNYMSAIISTGQATSGSSTPPTGILDTVSAPSSGSGYQASGSFHLSPGTYILYGTLRAANGLYYHIGSQVVSVVAPRPTNWSWTSAELSTFNNHGDPKDILYTRWNEFVDKVSAFRLYKGKSAVSSAAKMNSSDKVMTATRFNLVRAAIDEMISTGLPVVQKNDPCIGGYFVTLANRLNLIS